MQFYTLISWRLFSCLILVIRSNNGRETKRNSSSSKQIHFAISRLVVWQKGSCAKSWRISWRATLQGEDALSERESCLVWENPPFVRWLSHHCSCIWLSLWKRWRIRHLVRCSEVRWQSHHGLRLTFTLKKMENLPSCQILWATRMKKILSDAASHSRRSHQSVWCTRSRSS